MNAREKVMGRRALRKAIVAHQRRGRSIVFTNGCFDILHVGHLRSLEQAAGLGDVLVVGVNRDRRVRELKGAGRPVVPERQRAELIAGLACVDYVVLFAEPTATRLVRELRPDVVCKGGEYRDLLTPEREAVEKLGGRFVHLRQVPGLRSTHVIHRMLS